MSLILNILLWILIILLVVLALIIYILISKRSFFIEYTKLEGVIIKINLMFFKIKIFQSKIENQDEMQTKAEPKEKPKEIIKEKPKGKSKETSELFKDLSFSEIFSIIKDAVGSLNGLIAVLAKKIKLTNICFTLPIHSENPLKTQKMYGSVTNAFYLLSTQLQSKFYISYENPVFVADFENMLKDREYFYIKITARTGFLVAVLIYLYKQYVYYKKMYLTPKEKTENA